MLKYATIHGILTPLSLSNNCSAQGVKLLGYLKLSYDFMGKSLVGCVHSVSLDFCHRLNNICSDITCHLQI